MSANADIVLEGIRAFEANDYEAIARVWHRDAVVLAPEGWPEPGPFEGREAVIEQFRRLVSDLGEQHFRDIEVIAEGGDWVVVSFFWDIRGAGSGAAFTARITGAYRVRDGQQIEAHFCWTPEEALEAAGLTREE